MIKRVTIPWWMRHPTILILMLIIIMMSSADMMVHPMMGLLFKEQGLTMFQFSIYAAIGMGAQLICSLYNVRLMNWLGWRKVFIGAIGLSVGGVALRSLAIESGELWMHYLSLAVAAGAGMMTIMTGEFLFRQRLGDNDHIMGWSMMRLIRVAIMGVCIYASFQVPVNISAWLVTGVQIAMLVLAIWICYKEQAMKQINMPEKVPKKVLRWRSPAVKVSLGQFGVFMVMFSLDRLLPLVNKDHASVILPLIMLGRVVAEYLFSFMTDRNRKINSWLIGICRLSYFAGLGLILLGWGWWILIAIVALGVGEASAALIRHTSYAVSSEEEKQMGSAAPFIIDNMAGVCAFLYMGLFEIDEEGAKSALQGLLIPLGFSVICAWWLRRWHRLPEKNTA